MAIHLSEKEIRMKHICKTRPRCRTNLLLVVFLPVLLLAGVLPVFSDQAAAGEWRGSKEMQDGALHILNPAEPMEKRITSSPAEQWRLGGETDDEDEFFGLISRIITDKKGNVYLLDTQLSEVKIFSPTGEFLRSIGRQGEGPGEFQTPVGMFFTHDGNLGVMQVAPGKIVLLTPEGEPAGEHPVPVSEDGGFLIFRGGLFKGDNLVLSVSKNSFSEGHFAQKQYLCSIDKTGKELARYHEETVSIDFANAVLDDSKWNNFNNRWMVGKDGKVYSNTVYSNYSISVWNPEGKLEKVIEKEYSHHKRSQKELDLVNSIMSLYSRQVANAKVKINPFNSDINQIYARDDGSLWVLSSSGSRDKPDAALGVFDVFDENGRYVKQVTLMGQGNPVTDGYYFVGDRLYVVTSLLQASLALQAGGQAFDIGEEEPGPMEVICYKLDPNLEIAQH